MNELMSPPALDPNDVIGLVAVIGSISFATLTSLAAAIAYWAVNRQRQETLRLAIDKGASLAELQPQQPSAVRDFRQGMFFLTTGAGLGVALGISGGLEAAAFAAIPMAAGLGRIAVARATRRLAA